MPLSLYIAQAHLGVLYYTGRRRGPRATGGPTTGAAAQLCGDTGTVDDFEFHPDRCKEGYGGLSRIFAVLLMTDHVNLTNLLNSLTRPKSIVLVARRRRVLWWIFMGKATRYARALSEWPTFPLEPDKG